MRGSGMPDELEHLHRLSARRLLDTSWCARTASMSWSPTR